ncbi:MAG: hypothetical protein Q9187_001713 [Circinaria calcarea]
MSSSPPLSQSPAQPPPTLSLSSTLDSLFSQTLSPTATASLLTSSVSNSANINEALWHLWGAVFSAAASTPRHHAPLIDLLHAIRDIPSLEPSPPRSNGQDLTSSSTTSPEASSRLNWRSLPRFGAEWRSKHDMLRAWRDSGMSGEKERLANDPAAVPAGVQFVNFCEFSAKMVAARFEQVETVWGFIACRDALENGKWEEQGAARSGGRALLSPAEVYALDVSVAAQWVLHAADVLFTVGNSGLSDYWAKALEVQTEFWKGAPGFSRGRWELWCKRFRWAEEQGELGEESRVLAGKAAAKIEGLTEG